MGDSDSDLQRKKVYPKRMLVKLKCPNTNLSLTGICFENKVFSSRMQPPPYRRKYEESNGRKISSILVKSDYNMNPINQDYSFNFRMLAEPRSVYNGKTSSMPMASTGTSASCGQDIVYAISNGYYNRKELKIIKAAIDKLLRAPVRKLINSGCYGKRYGRKRRGYDSGEQGSDSSISTDVSSVTASCRSNKKRKIHESNVLIDCSGYIEHSSSKCEAPGLLNTTLTFISSQPSMPSFTLKRSLPVNYDIGLVQPTAPVMSQKERFNRSAIIPSIPENDEKEPKKANTIYKVLAWNKYLGRKIDTDSDEYIFTNVSQQKQVNAKRKLSIDDEDIFVANQKRQKTSPTRNNVEAQKGKASNDKPNDFVFGKPAYPARKSTKEKLISKPPALLVVVPQEPTMPESRLEKHAEEEENNKHEQSNSTCNSKNAAMRPISIKRKLYAPSVIDTEKINSGVDSVNNPHNSKYGGILMEKKRARKCLWGTDIKSDAECMPLPRMY